jgi:hypothetical protein
MPVQDAHEPHTFHPKNGNIIHDPVNLDDYNGPNLHLRTQGKANRSLAWLPEMHLEWPRF